MSSPQLILDTDILSLLMRKNPAVLAKASLYLAEHRQFTISIITRYDKLASRRPWLGMKKKESEFVAAGAEVYTRPQGT